MAIRWDQRSVGRAPLADIAVAAALLVYGQLELIYLGRAGVVACALSVLMTAAVALRRVWPLTVAVLVIGAYGLQAVALQPAPQVLANALAVLIVVYTVASVAGPSSSAPVLVMAILSFALIESDAGQMANVSGDAILVAAAWGIGWVVWRRRRQAARELAEAEAARRAAEANTELVLEQERRRIARELHDVVSHAVTVVILQARAGKHLLDSDLTAARDSLTAIEGAGEEALAEMRRLVSLLREPTLDTAPQPGLADLDEMVEAARASGADVRLVRTGSAVALGAGAELTAYRLVQEAVTNAIRHAPGAAVTVTIAGSAAGVTVTVADSGGVRVDPAGDGFGLLGMRERVELYGGHLDYGPAGDGWTVVASLPCDGTTPHGVRPLTTGHAPT